MNRIDQIFGLMCAVFCLCLVTAIYIAGVSLDAFELPE